MVHELAPLVRRLGLPPDPGDPTGCLEATVGTVTFVATMTGIGMQPGADAAHRVIDAGVDHVAVLGIAGGIGAGLEIGDVIAPAAVLHAGTGRLHVPAATGPEPRHGILRSSDDFCTDADVMAALVADGVIALDMETAAVAEACESRGVAWSVFRAISDRPADRLLDDGIWDLTGADGRADPEARRRYLDADPDASARLRRLAADMETAAEAAAVAALAAFTDVR
jgi:hypothetical protein